MYFNNICLYTHHIQVSVFETSLRILDWTCCHSNLVYSPYYDNLQGGLRIFEFEFIHHELVSKCDIAELLYVAIHIHW